MEVVEENVVKMEKCDRDCLKTKRKAKQTKIQFSVTYFMLHSKVCKCLLTVYVLDNVLCFRHSTCPLVTLKVLSV